jgi:hypothetical protein
MAYLLRADIEYDDGRTSYGIIIGKFGTWEAARAKRAEYVKDLDNGYVNISIESDEEDM